MRRWTAPPRKVEKKLKGEITPIPVLDPPFVFNAPPDLAPDVAH